MLALIDAVEAAGFKAVARSVVHTSRSKKEYDERAIQSKRSYLQCLLDAKAIFRQQPKFRSAQGSGISTEARSATIFKQQS